MDKVIPFLIVAVAAALVVAVFIIFGPVWAALAGVAAWISLTWYFADPTPIFGAGDDPQRVTFKQVLLNLARDVRDLLALDKIWAWLVSVWNYLGAQLGAAILVLDAFIAVTPDVKNAITASPHGLWLLLIFNFVAFINRRKAQA